MKTQTNLTSKNDKSQMCSSYTETGIGLYTERNIKRSVIWWTTYWILIFGIYIAASLVFDNFTMFAIVLILAAIFF